MEQGVNPSSIMFRVGYGEGSPGSGSGTVDPFPSSEVARLARSMMKARSRRRDFFKASLFSDPAWDILLQLFVAECEGRRVGVSAAGAKAGVPTTTALRWLTVLEHEGLISREDDPIDKRRVYLNLTETGLRLMHGYFEAGEHHPSGGRVVM